MHLNERGFTTTYALILMTVLLVLGAGLLPSANSMLKMTMEDRNSEIAQAAAESGMKRVISELYNSENNSNLPNWKNECVMRGNNNVTASIDNIYDNGTLYQITVSGTYKNVTKKVYTEIEHSHKSNSKLVDFTDYKILAFSPNKINSGAFTDGGKIFSNLNNGVNLNFLNLNLDDLSIKNFIEKILNLPSDTYITKNGIYDTTLPFPLSFLTSPHYCYTPEKLGMPTPVVMNKIEKVDPEFYNNYRNLTSEYMSDERYGYSYKNGKNVFTPKVNIGLRSGVWELDGDLILKGRDNMPLSPIPFEIRILTLIEPGQCILHIKGDLEVTNAARIGFFLDNDFAISNDQLKYMLIIVDGNVNIRTQAGVNFATIICYGKIDVGNMVNIFGSIQGKEGINISQNFLDVTPVNLFYKETGVKPFRDILQKINTKDTHVTTFKIRKWKNIK